MPKVRLTMENSAAAGTGSLKIFVHDEKRHRLRHVELRETEPGRFTAELVRFGEPDFEIWRVGVPSAHLVRYIPFYYRLESDGSYTMELATGRTSRAAYWRRSGIKDSTPVAQVPKDESPWLKIVLNADRNDKKNSQKLFVYNGLTKKTSYIDLQRDNDGRLSHQFKVDHVSEPVIQSYQIGVSSAGKEKYYSFEYYFANPRHAEIHLKPQPRLAASNEIERFIRLQPFETAEQEVATQAYKSGTQLFQEQKYQESLPFFEVSHRDSRYEESSEYHIGVARYQTGDFEGARPSFTKLASKEKGDLRSYSHYYLATDQIRTRDYEGASRRLASLVEDPLVPQDLKSNSLELLSQARDAKKQEERLSTRGGGYAQIDFLQYDSNVPGLPGSLISSSKQGGLGFGGQWGAWYYPLLDDKKEVSLNYAGLGSYHPDDDFISYDTWGHFVSSRLTWKRDICDKASRISVTPGVGFMQSQYSGERKVPPTEALLNTYFLQNQVSTFVRDDRLVEFNVNFKYDENRASIYAGDDDPSGFGAAIGSSVTQYLNEERTSSYSLGAKIEWINSIGRNYRQLKPSLLVGAERMLPYEVRGKIELSGYYDSYLDHYQDRKDSQVKLELSFSHYLTPEIWLMQAFLGSSNDSNVEAGQYTRFVTTTSMGMSF